jgi:carbonic anhydrase
MSAFPELAPYLAGNEQWAATTTADSPDFLSTLAQGQSPRVLWIGCADSRVPETTILGCRPGDVFVHRNIANQFQKDDNSAHAVLEYGVLHVGVQHGEWK